MTIAKVLSLLFFISIFQCPILLAQSVPPGFVIGTVASGFTKPIGFEFDANGIMYVWEKRGMVHRVVNGVTDPVPFLDISDEVGDWGDHGLIGFALDPDFVNNHRVYLTYNVDREHLLNYGTPSYDPTANQYLEATIMRITRYEADPANNYETIDPNSRFILVGQSQTDGIPNLHKSHCIGSIVFGEDGTMLISVGDGASYSSTDVGSASETYWSQALNDGIIRPEENVGAFRSQMVDSYNGKILRIDPNTGAGIVSNPFYDPNDPYAVRSKVWALGLRNGFRMNLLPGTGATDPFAGDPGTMMWGDVQWGLWEEWNLCDEGGQNFGWPMFEGHTPHLGYTNALTENLDAPNPLYNGGSCTQQFFDFQDLLIQDTQAHSNLFPNPCNGTVQIPSSVETFVHTRPVIDWRHGSTQIARTKGFSNGQAVTFDLDDPNSPLPGPMFSGNAASGGHISKDCHSHWDIKEWCSLRIM